MAIQSRPPGILLTRPEAQSRRFAAELRQRFSDVPVIVSPLMTPKYLRPTIPERNWSAAIFTSETAVLSAQRIFADLKAPPIRAFCVGDHTAQVAEHADFLTLSADGGAASLIALIKQEVNTGPMLYLHGRETRGDIENQLSLAGIETFSAISYAQEPQPLTDEAVDILHSLAQVIAPIFSPRTGSIFAAECVRIRATAKLSIVAISGAAAAPFASIDMTVCLRPTASAMMEAITLRLTSLLNP